MNRRHLLALLGASMAPLPAIAAPRRSVIASARTSNEMLSRGGRIILDRGLRDRIDGEWAWVLDPDPDGAVNRWRKSLLRNLIRLDLGLPSQPPVDFSRWTGLEFRAQARPGAGLRVELFTRESMGDPNIHMAASSPVVRDTGWIALRAPFSSFVGKEEVRVHNVSSIRFAPNVKGEPIAVADIALYR